jgi:hypothetical protein
MPLETAIAPYPLLEMAPERLPSQPNSLTPVPATRFRTLSRLEPLLYTTDY